MNRVARFFGTRRKKMAEDITFLKPRRLLFYYQEFFYLGGELYFKK